MGAQLRISKYCFLLNLNFIDIFFFFDNRGCLG